MSTDLKEPRFPQRRNSLSIDLSGFRFGSLVVAQRVDNPRNGKYKNCAHWLCICDCGNQVTMPIRVLRVGNDHSCGCVKAQPKLHSLKHGHARSSGASYSYRSWQKMRQRCLDKNHKHYPSYGGRGITICERWNSFEVFLEDMGERPYGHTLDRINVDGNYDPGNCRWATAEMQNNNKRGNRFLIHQGRTLTFAQWARETGISPNVIRLRANHGWSAEKILTTPTKAMIQKNMERS